MRWKQLLSPIENLDADAARKYMDEHGEGEYTLLDVRQPGEYDRERIPGSKLIPLPALMDRIGELDPEKPVLTY